MEIEYQQALVFTITFGIICLFAIILVIAMGISAIMNNFECKCQYDWGKTIEGEEFPRCVKCNEIFKVI